MRHLRDIGVEVRFEKENVNSMTEEGELMLTLLAVFSQEESVSISENCKWGIRKRFQEETVGTANKHLLTDYVFNTPADPGRNVDCVKQRIRFIRKNLDYLRK